MRTPTDDDRFGARFVAEVRRRSRSTFWPYTTLTELQGADRQGTVEVLTRLHVDMPDNVWTAFRDGSPEDAAAAFLEEVAARREDPVEDFERLLAGATSAPLATPLLIAVNVAVFAAMAVTTERPFSQTAADLLTWGANFGPLTLRDQWWRTLSSAFLHVNPIHLALNMAALWNVGRLLERLLGVRLFCAVYLGCAVGGSLASAASRDIVSVGASGAVFGLFGSLLAYVARQHGWPSQWVGWRGSRPRASLPAVPSGLLRRLRQSAIAFVGWNVAFGLMYRGIDNAAHLGGLVAGLASGFLIWRGREVSRPSSPA